MLNLINHDIPLPYKIAATYFFLTAGGLVLWCYWDKLSSLTTNPQGSGGGTFLLAFTLITTILLAFLLSGRISSSSAAAAVAASRFNPVNNIINPQSPHEYSRPTGEEYQYSRESRPHTLRLGTSHNPRLPLHRRRLDPSPSTSPSQNI
ncbi:hypothetical protein CERZMDRAFT_86639 [Cercospora zeae-maydis SCOH1-5]|uniref:Uncharacterized protein n=1 Tax=Cercospora zeae-maydis SCOH1-5 TaxID=717836 RepID=A0A6A6F5D1_9PEZI|nr:hypothetical protein CERZMDRAFT_86639 [Cercospora zeae-maydis SCOH1-5]